MNLQEPGETALHFAVRTADQTSLPLVDFIVQNWWGLLIFFNYRTCIHALLHVASVSCLKFWTLLHFSFLHIFCISSGYTGTKQVSATKIPFIMILLLHLWPLYYLPYFLFFIFLKSCLHFLSYIKLTGDVSPKLWKFCPKKAHERTSHYYCLYCNKLSPLLACSAPPDDWKRNIHEAAGEIQFCRMKEAGRFLQCRSSGTPSTPAKGAVSSAVVTLPILTLGVCRGTLFCQTLHIPFKGMQLLPNGTHKKKKSRSNAASLPLVLPN